MTTEFPPAFARQYESHLKHLKLKGLQPKTIDAYSRAIRRLGGYFDYRIDALSEAQLTEYFSDLIGTHSWSAVKLDLYGLKFFTQHVLKQPWAMPDLIKAPKTQRLPDIVTTLRRPRRRPCKSSRPARRRAYRRHGRARPENGEKRPAWRENRRILQAQAPNPAPSDSAAGPPTRFPG